MIMFAGFDTLTWIHTLLSVVALIAGAVGIKGLIESRVMPFWTEVYLLTAVLTSATGFLFSAPFQASHVTGIICLVLLAAALLGLYVFKLRGPWRWIYVLGFVLSTYLDYFVLVVQLFRKVPALNALAPTQGEPPFAVAQLVLLAIFIWLTVKAARKFHPPTA
jgi:hypothetical protein